MSFFKSTQLIDENGVPYGVKHINNKPRVSAMPYAYDIGEGNIVDHVAWTKIGFSPAVNTTDSDIWSKGGVYVFPTASAKMEMVSSDNTQDIGTVIKTGTSTGGSLTSLIDAGANFTAATAVAIGDAVLLDKSGTVPEFGYVTAVVSATELTIAGGFCCGGTGSGRTYHIVDKSAYTHAQVVRIEYLTSALATKTELVVLNGTTTVDTINTDIFRINSFRVVVTGTANVPKGNLSCNADGGAITYSYILAGFTRARNTIYTVPAGKALFVLQFSAAWATTGNANKEYGRIFTRANVDPSTKFNTGSIFYPYTEMMMQNSTAIVQIDVPTKLPAGTDIKVSGIASATGACSVVLRGWLENE